MQRQLYLLHLVDQLRALVTGHRRPEDVRVDPFLDGGLGRDRHGHSTQRRKPTRSNQSGGERNVRADEF
jgi:hypothetical protein